VRNAQGWAGLNIKSTEGESWRRVYIQINVYVSFTITLTEAQVLSKRFSITLLLGQWNIESKKLVVVSTCGKRAKIDDDVVYL